MTTIVRSIRILLHRFPMGAWVVLVSVLLASSFQKAHADTVSTVSVTHNGGGTGCGGNGAPNEACTGNFSQAYGPYAAVYTGTASAWAQYGILHSSSFASASCNAQAPFSCYDPEGVLSVADSQFQDTLTISGAAPNSSLVLYIQVEGTESTATNGPSNQQQQQFGSVQTELHSSGSEDNGGPLTGFTPEQTFFASSGINSFMRTYALGIPGAVAQLPIELDLKTVAQCGTADQFSCTSSSDFSDTAIVTGFQVIDADGSVDHNAVVTAASGTNYNSLQSTTAATPEPSPVILCITGLVGAVSASRQFRRAFRNGKT